MSEDPIFPGFQSPRYTQTPNDLFDQLLRPGLLTEAELRVLLYIIRRTFGWSKDSDAISLSQLTGGIVTTDGRRLDYGAGIQRKAAYRAVAALEAKGMIIVERRRSPGHGDETNTYRLRWLGEGLKDPPPGSPGPSPRVPNAPAPESQRLPQNERTKHNETIEGMGLALAAVLSPYGGAWGNEQARAAALCQARGWSPAQLAQVLAAQPEQTLRAKLKALEK
jgi:hypothetical protein